MRVSGQGEGRVRVRVKSEGRGRVHVAQPAERSAAFLCDELQPRLQRVAVPQRRAQVGVGLSKLAARLVAGQARPLDG